MAKNRRAEAKSPSRKIERLIEDGRYKDAWKQARTQFRVDPSPENRKLFEQSSVLRTRELADRGFGSEAKEVAAQLLDAGVTTSELLEELIVLLPRIGMQDRALALQSTLTSPDALAKLQMRLLDAAILDPNNLPPDSASAQYAELREGSSLIRAAIQDALAGDTAEANSRLQPIPRNSPLADWRLFVRGLLAYREHADDQAIANWQRLDASRPASRIARVLSACMDSSPSDERTRRVDLTKLEAAVNSPPVLVSLRQIVQGVEEDNWNRVFTNLRAARQGLNSIDRRLAQRLTEGLLPAVQSYHEGLSSHGRLQFVDTFSRTAEPTSCDPKWNRFRALLCEGDDASGAIRNWRSYLTDIDEVDFSPVEPRRVKALVLKHIGDGCRIEMAEQAFSKKSDSDEFRARAIEAFEQSLEFDETQRETYYALLDVYEDQDDSPEAYDVARRLLRQFPDDLRAYGYLINFHVRRDQPGEALPYAERLLALKPLDADVIKLMSTLHLAAARHHALAGNFEEGRAAIARGEALNSNLLHPSFIIARKIVFELKAGEETLAMKLFKDAESYLTDLTTFHLTLSIESRRFRVSQNWQNGFEEYFQKRIAGPIRSETVWGIASTFFIYSNTDYPGKKEHLQSYLKYLRRISRSKVEEEHLFKACEFLESLGNETKLEDSLVKRGLKLYPDSPLFLLQSAKMEIIKGPFRANLKTVRQLLDRAAQAANASPERYGYLIPQIQQQQLGIKDLNDGAAAFASHAGLDYEDDNPFTAMQTGMLEMLRQAMMDGELPPEAIELLGGELDFEDLAPPKRKRKK